MRVPDPRPIDARRPRRHLADLTALAVLLGPGVLVMRCGGTEVEPIDPVEVRRVLVQAAEHVVLPTCERFVVAAAALEDATEAYATSLTETDRDVSRAAWLEAMDVWQRLEVMQIGPSAPTSRPGGRALRDEIDSWPLTNECRIDEEIVEGTYADREAFAAEMVNVRGLDAMEYLLFHEGPDNSCAPVSEINATGSWAALGEEELTARRAAYAATLAHLVRTRADELASAWRPSGEDFAGRLGRAGSDPYFDPSIGLSALGDALYYVDMVVKDEKLTATTRDEMESPHALRSREHVLANLEAFEEIFLGAAPGTDAPGLDDLLRLVGEAELADEVVARIGEARAAVEAIEEPAELRIAERPAVLSPAREAVQRMSDELESRVLPALLLRVPAEASGDTD